MKRVPDVLTMAEAMALLKTTRTTFHRWLKSGRIRGTKVGRQWRFERAEIERVLRGDEPRVEAGQGMSDLADQLARTLREAGVTPPAGTDEDPTLRAVQFMIRLGVIRRASDIHLSAHLPSGGAEPEGVLRFRVDGVLQMAARFGLRVQSALVERLKALAGCDIRESVRPQDGRFLGRLSEPGAVPSADDPSLDLRLCFLPAAHAESVTIRILDRSQSLIRLDQMDFTPDDRERLDRALAAPSGLILVTGPAGSGKTTTLYAALNEVARPELKAMSVEDPVEYLLPWVTQTSLRAQDGLTYARALRSILRSDPDVILVGEIRDLEAASVAIQASLSGNLVFSTLHTDDAAIALVRLVNMGLDPWLVGDSVRLVTAQRLVRKLCPTCRRPAPPAPGLLKRVRAAAEAGGLPGGDLADTFWDAVGCPSCVGGYRGRTLVAEMLAMSPELAVRLRAGTDPDALRIQAVAGGMTTLAADGIRRVSGGQTSLDELRRLRLI